MSTKTACKDTAASQSKKSGTCCVNFYRETFYNEDNKRLIEAAKKNDWMYLLRHITEQDFAHPEEYSDEYFDNRPGLHLIHTYIDRLPQNKKSMIVDIACGNGALLKELQKKGYSVAGLDISPVRVLGGQQSMQNFYFGLVEQMPLPDMFTDVAIATECLEHCFNLDRTLSECARIMKRNGILLITVPLGNNSDSYNHLRHFTPETLRSSLIPHGFAIRHMSLIPYLQGEQDNNIFCVATRINEEPV